jgi:hypothetical protein
MKKIKKDDLGSVRVMLVMHEGHYKILQQRAKQFGVSVPSYIKFIVFRERFF